MIPPNPTQLTINKDLKIVVHFNNSERKAILKDVSTDIILKDLNTRIESMGYRILRTVKRLLSGDFAILTVNNEEVENLRNNSHWAGVLGGNARVITRTYSIMINGVRMKDFEMTNKDYAIEHIKACNTDIEVF